MSKAIFSLLGLLFFLSSCSEHITLDELLIKLENDQHAMGTVSIFKDGREIYNNSFGYKILETKEIANSETRYWIGSVTKTYTATVILQLIDEGKLGFNTKLYQFFPEISNANDISMQHLLQHRSGINDITNEPDFEVWIAEPRSREEMINRIKSHNPEFVPGTETSYSNSNYIILSYIAEHVDKKPFRSILSDRIFKPLDLKRTTFADTLNLANNEAMDYFPENSQWKPIVYQTNLIGTMGAGGIISTAREVNEFYHALFSGELISQPSFSKMITIKNEFGLGVSYSYDYGQSIYGHSGSIDGFRSNVAYVPEKQLSISLTFNCSKVSMTTNLKSVFEAYQYTFED